jgi:hypothetical protein
MVRPRLLVSRRYVDLCRQCTALRPLAVLLSAEQAHPVPDQPTVTSAGAKARG